MPTFQKFLGNSPAKKICAQVPTCRLVPLNVKIPLKNYDGWRERVGMFFAKQVLVVQTIKYLLQIV